MNDYGEWLDNICLTLGILGAKNPFDRSDVLKIRELIKKYEELEKAFDNAIKKITLDNDEGFESLDSQYEFWKQEMMKDVE